MHSNKEIKNVNGQVVGYYKVEWHIFYFNKIGTYDWISANPVSNNKYYDENLSSNSKVRFAFNNHVVLQCRKHQCLLEIEDEGEEWMVTMHQYGGGVMGDINPLDLTKIVHRIKAERHRTLNDIYHAQI